MYTSAVVEVRQLVHRFARQQAPVLHGLDLTIPENSIYGFLGPNGAGKTTTLRLILGLLQAQQGEIRLFGESLRQNRIAILRQVGSLIEHPSLYAHLTGRENLEVYRRVYNLPSSRIGEVLGVVGLSSAAGKKVKAYSLGMKQRLAIAVSLLHDPRLLILDEPTNGLDPAGIVETRELLMQLNREFGKTILVSSHLLAEVEKMATHVGIIHKGRKLFEGSLLQLQDMRRRQSHLLVEVEDVPLALALMKDNWPSAKPDGNGIALPYRDKQQTAEVIRCLCAAGVDVYSASVQQFDLEKVFMELTSKEESHVDQHVFQ